MCERANLRDVSADVDAVNRPVWSGDDALGWFQRAEGWIDDGERGALLTVAPEVRGQPLLDVGVGGGRTTSLLRLLSDDYLAVDYSPAMVELCHRNHPDVDVRLGDARALDLPDGHFGLVLFSFNGIDAVGRADRARVLAELFRVTRPGGLALVSTINKDGPLYRHRPWRLLQLSEPASYQLVRLLIALPVRAPMYARGFRNWRRVRPLAEDHGGWAMAPLAAHEFSLLVHYTTLAQAFDDVGAAGFTVVTALGNDGRPVHPGEGSTDVASFQLILRRPV